MRAVLSAFALFIFFATLCAAQSASPSGATGQTLRDGQHDFDFDIGIWKTHSSRLLHPLSGSKTWADMDGLTVVKPIWHGRANLAEYMADGPAGHVELLALRYYNPQARQWSVAFATPSRGTLSIPAVGEFKSGRGDFYDQEDFNGRSILVRFSIFRTGPNTAQSEQAFSPDGGKTWEINWINNYTRVEGATISWPSAELRDRPPEAHDFDFGVGKWHTHIDRIPDPFSTTVASYQLDGTVTSREVWGGRALLEEIEADGPKGHWEGMTLFLYNPKSHQWSQNFINSSMGVLDASLVGSFSDGRGEFFQQDTFKGRSILVRGVWSNITVDAHSYSESYSDDGGKTWKPAFIARKTRIKDDATAIPAGAVRGGSEPACRPVSRVGQFDFQSDRRHSSGDDRSFF